MYEKHANKRKATTTTIREHNVVVFNSIFDHIEFSVKTQDIGRGK